MLWNRSYQVNDKTPEVTSELKKNHVCDTLCKIDMCQIWKEHICKTCCHHICEVHMIYICGQQYKISCNYSLESQCLMVYN